jgi:hypothetical protein
MPNDSSLPCSTSATCTQDILAEPFGISRRTIGNVVCEGSPILAGSGYLSTPGAPRFTTATALLNSLTAAATAASTPTS